MNRKLDKTIEHDGIILLVELIEVNGLITEINLWTNNDDLYASPLLVPSDPSMLLIKDSGVYEGITDTLVHAEIVKIRFNLDDVQVCSLLV